MGMARLVWTALLIIVSTLGAAKAETPQASKDESGNTVLVSNSRVSVTKADFDADIERIPEQDRFEFLSSRERIGKVLEDILMRKTLASEAVDSGLDKLPGTQRKLAMARENVLATVKIQSLEQETKAPDFELRAKEIFRADPDKFAIKPMVRASHILISTKSRNREEALKLAREVHALAKSGEDFGKLAEKYSDDSGSKGKQGELGFFTADMMVKPFAAAAFSMKPGEISEPVESEYGFHVIRVEEIKLGAKQEFDAVKGKIVNELKVEYSKELIKNHLTKIRTDKSIKINEEAILKIKTTRPTAESR